MENREFVKPVLEYGFLKKLTNFKIVKAHYARKHIIIFLQMLIGLKLKDNKGLLS